LKRRRIFRLDTWEEREEREEREGLKGFAFDHQQGTKDEGDESGRHENGNTEKSTADNEREADTCEGCTLARRGHKRRGERERRDLLIGAHVRMIGTDHGHWCRTLCQFFRWFFVSHGWTL
jgi:hypothetical protein